MADALEKSILDGSFFRGPRTPSPTRSASTGSPAGSDDERGGREDDGDGERDGLDDEGITAPAGTTAQSSRRPKQGSSNTGPKGVRADRDAHNIAQKEMYRQRIQETNAQLQKMALLGATSEEQEELIKAQAILKHQLKEEEARDRGSKSDQEEDDDEDREVMQRYRQARLAQMRREQQQSNSSGHRFGHLIEIHDDKQYLDAIEAEEDNDDVAVIVHIYSKDIQRCRQLTASLSSLARQRTSSKFVQVQATTIDFGQDDDVLPTVLAYKGGNLVANLVRIDLDEQYGHGQEKDLERVLKSHRALS